MKKLTIRNSPRLLLRADAVPSAQRAPRSPFLDGLARRVIRDADWLVRQAPLREDEGEYYGRARRWMQSHIEWICEHIGPRPPCSDGERKLGEYLKSRWSRHSDKTFLEEFTCHPDAYPATFRWPIALFIISLCLYHLLPLLSLLGSTLSVLILVFNLMLNVELIDRLFPEKKSLQIYGNGTRSSLYMTSYMIPVLSFRRRHGQKEFA